MRIWLTILTLGLIAGVFFKPFSVIKNPLGGEMIGATTYDGSAVQGFWNRSHIRRLEMGVVKSEEELPRFTCSERMKSYALDWTYDRSQH